MADEPDDLAARLEEIKQMFLQRVRDEWLPRLDDLRRRLRAEWNAESLKEAVYLSHTLAGSGATFGYRAMGTVGRETELATRAILREPADLGEEARAAILDGLGRLDGEIRAALGDLRD